MSSWYFLKQKHEALEREKIKKAKEKKASSLTKDKKL